MLEITTIPGTESATLRRCKPMLGTYVTINLAAETCYSELARISSLGFSAIKKVENLMSYHQPDSELSQINALAHKTPISLHPFTEKVLRYALNLARETDGLFDPTIAPHLVSQHLLPAHLKGLTETSNWKNITIHNHHISFSKPTHIDLGGIAKGYAVDLARSVIEKEFSNIHVSDARININAGGDLTMSHWQGEVANIRHPSSSEPFKALNMLNSSLATSSYCFMENNKRSIINPLTHKSLPLSKSVSIFSSSCMEADALTKIYALHPESMIHKKYNAHPIIF